MQGGSYEAFRSEPLYGQAPQEPRRVTDRISAVSVQSKDHKTAHPACSFGGASAPGRLLDDQPLYSAGHCTAGSLLPVCASTEALAEKSNAALHCCCGCLPFQYFLCAAADGPLAL